MEIELTDWAKEILKEFNDAHGNDPCFLPRTDRDLYNALLAEGASFTEAQKRVYKVKVADTWQEEAKILRKDHKKSLEAIRLWVSLLYYPRKPTTSEILRLTDPDYRAARKKHDADYWHRLKTERPEQYQKRLAAMREYARKRKENK